MVDLNVFVGTAKFALVRQEPLEQFRAPPEDLVGLVVEGPTKRNPAEWFGKSAHFKTTVFPHRGERVGDLISVRVAAATPHALLGEGVRAATFEDVTV